jgi:serine O-acetyltransferase
MQVRDHAQEIADSEPQLTALLYDVVLNRACLGEALAARLSRKLSREEMNRDELTPLLVDIFVNQPRVTQSAAADMMAIFERDAACKSPLEPMIFFKGFMAISTYRVAHHLWHNDRKPLALYFQSICSEVFGVDIHPAARIGCGLLLDHATSVVIGETAIVEDNVSILHEVTLGGTGKVSGDRHPVVRSGVLIGAGSKILGRVEIGRCAKVGAGSVVLTDVPEHVTVAGVPAKIRGKANTPAMDMNQCFESGLI